LHLLLQLPLPRRQLLEHLLLTPPEHLAATPAARSYTEPHENQPDYNHDGVVALCVAVHGRAVSQGHVPEVNAVGDAAARVVAARGAAARLAGALTWELLELRGGGVHKGLTQYAPTARSPGGKAELHVA